MIPFLNVDAGESDDEPEELYRLAHTVNVACGGHAGDEASMLRVLRVCAQAGTRVAAHPSYPDRENFGRRSMAMDPAVLRAAVAEQCATLHRVSREAGIDVGMVKAHGALYHDANRAPDLAAAFVEGAAAGLSGSPAIVGPPSGELRRAAETHGLAFVREGFADRGTTADGSLIPRGQPGALIADPTVACATAERLARSDQFDTLCVHGDTPSSLEIARAVRALLDSLS
jgi:UPF0271 protein